MKKLLLLGVALLALAACEKPDSRWITVVDCADVASQNPINKEDAQ